MGRDVSGRLLENVFFFFFHLEAKSFKRRPSPSVLLLAEVWSWTRATPPPPSGGQPRCRTGVETRACSAEVMEYCWR